MSCFKWGMRSKLRMRTMHPDLRKVFDAFIEITPRDVTILEVARSVSRQKQLVESGASRTMNSRHIPINGVVYAADIGVLAGSRVVWTWDLYEEAAETMRDAAKLTGIPVRWGGCWEILNTLNDPIADEVRAYSARSKAAGVRPFLDGGHFELPRSDYP